MGMQCTEVLAGGDCVLLAPESRHLRRSRLCKSHSVQFCSSLGPRPPRGWESSPLSAGTVTGWVRASQAALRKDSGGLSPSCCDTKQHQQRSTFQRWEAWRRSALLCPGFPRQPLLYTVQCFFREWSVPSICMLEPTSASLLSPGSTECEEGQQAEAH